jgi:hypothetical protein
VADVVWGEDLICGVEVAPLVEEFLYHPARCGLVLFC